MNHISILFAGWLAMALVSVIEFSTYAQIPQDVPIPDGYEQLFEEISKAMEKYPGAAARFSIHDRNATGNPDAGDTQGGLMSCLLRASL